MRESWRVTIKLGRRMKTPIFVSAAAIAASFSGGWALAAPVNVTLQGSHVMYDTNDQNAWYAETDYMAGDVSVTGIAAGAFRLFGTDEDGVISDFLAFCLEPLESLILPQVHQTGSNFSAAITTRLNTLAQNAMGLVTNHETAAAFQFAAWEITTETSGSYDILDGFFRVTGNLATSNAAEGIAQGWLDNIAEGSWGAPSESYMILNASGTQDLLTNVVTGDLAPVPLPASGLMLLTAAIGAGGMAARRRRQQR